jgi:HTH-type transcriptional regulator, competence development regulator
MIEDLGEYVAALRAHRGLTLRKIEELTGIPNAYLSQLETGQKKHLPPPTLLSKLSECLGVSTNDLLAKAGYLKQSVGRDSLEQQIDKAFRHAVSDPQFRYGAALKNKYDFNIKRFVVELYEKATGRSILEKPFPNEATSSVAGQIHSKGTSDGAVLGSSGRLAKRERKTATVSHSDRKLSIRSNRKEGL